MIYRIYIPSAIGGFGSSDIGRASGKTEYCIFEYRYRDAANYKQHEDILLYGSLEPNDVEAIVSVLNQDQQFIPEQVGLTSLQHRFAEFGAVPGADDHVWHEFVSFREAGAADLVRLMPSGLKDVLVEAFSNIDFWDEKLSPSYNALRRQLAGRMVPFSPELTDCPSPNL
jgi:hypothetical protein